MGREQILQFWLYPALALAPWGQTEARGLQASTLQDPKPLVVGDHDSSDYLDPFLRTHLLGSPPNPQGSSPALLNTLPVTGGSRSLSLLSEMMDRLGVSCPPSPWVRRVQDGSAAVPSPPGPRADSTKPPVTSLPRAVLPEPPGYSWGSRGKWAFSCWALTSNHSTLLHPSLWGQVNLEAGRGKSSLCQASSQLISGKQLKPSKPKYHLLCGEV